MSLDSNIVGDLTLAIADAYYSSVKITVTGAFYFVLQLGDCRLMAVPKEKQTSPHCYGNIVYDRVCTTGVIWLTGHRSMITADIVSHKLLGH